MYSYRSIIRTLFLMLSIAILSHLSVYGQSEKKAVRKGNKEYHKGHYLDSEISYRSGLEENKESFKANFNLGDALYKQDKLDEAGSIFQSLTESKTTDINRANAFYNLGNTYFKNQQLEESIQAYKEALRLNPNDYEAKYNLAQALRLMEQLQNQDNQNQQNNEDGEGDENQKEQQQQNQDQDKDKDKEDKENKQDNHKDDQQEQQQQEEREQQISPEDAQRMLDAIQDKEKEIQERAKEEKARQAKIKVEKNW